MLFAFFNFAGQVTAGTRLPPPMAMLSPEMRGAPYNNLTAQQRPLNSQDSQRPPLAQALAGTIQPHQPTILLTADIRNPPSHLPYNHPAVMWTPPQVLNNKVPAWPLQNADRLLQPPSSNNRTSDWARRFLVPVIPSQAGRVETMDRIISFLEVGMR